jgi:hypothetical protein
MSDAASSCHLYNPLASCFTAVTLLPFRVLRFSKRCSWGFRSSKMRRWTNNWITTYQGNCSALIFKGWNVLVSYILDSSFNPLTSTAIECLYEMLSNDTMNRFEKSPVITIVKQRVQMLKLSQYSPGQALRATGGRGSQDFQTIFTWR